MKFNLAVPTEAKKADGYMEQLRSKGNLIELKKVSPARSLSQNSYLHLILGAFAQHFGYTLDEAKQIYKELSPGIYRYPKKGRVFWRSSAELSKEDMAITIDRFMQKSAEAGYPLPLATDQEWIRHIENEIERSKHYM